MPKAKKPGAWSRPLTRVLVTRDGERIGTLIDAANYILALPETVQQRGLWQHATKLLMEAAAGGDVKAATDQMARAMFIEFKLDPAATPVE